MPYNGTPTVTMGTLRNSNPDLRWETRSTFNIGTDLGLFNNRLLLTAEYYYSKTTDMLYEYDVPVPTFAFDKLLANIGSMSNSGFEVGIGLVPISKERYGTQRQYQYGHGNGIDSCHSMVNIMEDR